MKWKIQSLVQARLASRQPEALLSDLPLQKKAKVDHQEVKPDQRATCSNCKFAQRMPFSKTKNYDCCNLGKASLSPYSSYFPLYRQKTYVGSLCSLVESQNSIHSVATGIVTGICPSTIQRYSWHSWTRSSDSYTTQLFSIVRTKTRSNLECYNGLPRDSYCA